MKPCLGTTQLDYVTVKSFLRLKESPIKRSKGVGTLGPLLKILMAAGMVWGLPCLEC